MTFGPRKRWPAVAERRRAVIACRTATGEACTLIVERQPDGPLLVSFHGAWRTTAAPCRNELAAFVDALNDAAR